MRNSELKKQRKRQHWLSFWTGVFRLRCLLTPLCIEHIEFTITDNEVYNYHDIRVFGFRIIRLHKD
jgi:hypothetical protein